MLTQKNRGILCIILSAFSFALMGMFLKLAGDLPSIEKSFFRNLVAAVIAFVMLLRSRESVQIQKRNLHWFILRSLFGTLGIFCNFYAVDHLVLSDASSLNKLSPFFVIVFSYFVLKEKITPAQCACVAAAFAGSLFIVKPSFAAGITPASIIGFCGGMCAGFAYTCVRKLGLRGERGPVIVLFFSVFSMLACIPFMIADFHPITGTQLVFLMLTGLAAAGGQFGITAAYTYAPGREISVYDYTQIMFSAILGFFFFGQVPDGWSFLGYLIIIAAGIVIFLYNKKYGGD